MLKAFLFFFDNTIEHSDKLKCVENGDTSTINMLPINHLSSYDKDKESSVLDIISLWAECCPGASSLRRTLIKTHLKHI